MTGPTTFEDLLVERDAPIARVTINRPAVRNACRFRTTVEIGLAMRELEEDDSIRAVVLTGAGDRAFSAGADLKELRGKGARERERELAEGWIASLRRIETMPKPVVAAVRGFAVGGGTELAMACHLRVAGESARFGQPEILRGHIPGAGGTVRLPRLVGTGRALQYLLTGDDIPAAEAERCGLVNWVVADAAVVETAEAVARRIAALPALAVQLTLQSVIGGRDCSVESALVLEQAMCNRMRHDRDYREGLEAFADKRVPEYNRG